MAGYQNDFSTVTAAGPFRICTGFPVRRFADRQSDHLHGLNSSGSAARRGEASYPGFIPLRWRLGRSVPPILP